MEVHLGFVRTCGDSGGCGCHGSVVEMADSWVKVAHWLQTAFTILLYEGTHGWKVVVQRTSVVTLVVSLVSVSTHTFIVTPINPFFTCLVHLAFVVTHSIKSIGTGGGTTESTEEFAVILSPASMRCADISAIALTVCQFVGAFGEVHNVLVWTKST